jgi:hypothetical protein
MATSASTLVSNHQNYVCCRFFFLVYLKMCVSGNRTAHQYAKLASHIKLMEGKVASLSCVQSVFSEHEYFKIGPRCF